MSDKACYLKVDCNPRYWEDAELDGQQIDEAGDFPFREGDVWRPTIDIVKGRIIDWPAGHSAFIHFKVCDAGEYFLVDESGAINGKYKSDYVPDILSPKENGYGDYIIMDVDDNGFIDGWDPLAIDDEQWPVPEPPQ